MKRHTKRPPYRLQRRLPGGYFLRGSCPCSCSPVSKGRKTPARTLSFFCLIPETGTCPPRCSDSVAMRLPGEVGVRPLGGVVGWGGPDTPDCQGRRTAGAAKGDGQPGLPRTTASWGRYPLQDLGQTVVSIISVARDLRPKGEGFSAKIENPPARSSLQDHFG